MSKAKLPFNLDTLEADRAFIPIYPENKQWLIVLKGTELGDKLCSLLEPLESEEDGVYGLWLDKIYGLYQEERQLLEEQIENYYNEKLTFQKHIAKVAQALGVDNDKAIELLDDPYSDGIEQGEKLEPFLENFRELALKLTKLETRLNEDAIAVVMRKRFKIQWTKEETEMLHEGMKKALSEFISNEQKGWTEKSVVGSSSSRESEIRQSAKQTMEPSFRVGENYELQTTNDKLNGGNDTPSQTGSQSTTTSNFGAQTNDSTT